MNFFKTKMWGSDVNVLFTGPNYFFFHGFHGLICIAERNDDVELQESNGNSNVWHSKFTLYAGHRDYDYAKECFEMAKRVIERYDQQHVKKVFEYEEIETDLNKCLVSVTYDLHRFG